MSYSSGSSWMIRSSLSSSSALSAMAERWSLAIFGNLPIQEEETMGLNFRKELTLGEFQIFPCPSNQRAPTRLQVICHHQCFSVTVWWCGAPGAVAEQTGQRCFSLPSWLPTSLTQLRYFGDHPHHQHPHHIIIPIIIFAMPINTQYHTPRHREWKMQESLVGLSTMWEGWFRWLKMSEG